MTPAQLIKPASLRVHHEPFPYFTARAALSHSRSVSLLKWLESKADWKVVEAAFYEQHELCWPAGQRPGSVSQVFTPAFFGAIRQEVGGIFHRLFAARIDCTVHKLIPGQRIRIHNDLHSAGETHRVILHLNRGWGISSGGLLMLFNSANPADVHRVLLPLNGSIIGFAISEQSNHAVSLILNGERFAIVYSLYADD